MIPESPDVRDLVRGINNIVSQVVKDTNAAIVVRTYDGVFLYVDDVWVERYKVDPRGKTISELGILSAEEGERSIAEDEVVKRDGMLVTVDTYHINDVPVRMAVVRVLVRYKSVDYMVGVLYNTGADYYGTSDEVQQSYGELLAFRLQRLSDSIF